VTAGLWFRSTAAATLHPKILKQVIEAIEDASTEPIPPYAP
jgi:hypothetical protein